MVNSTLPLQSSNVQKKPKRDQQWYQMMKVRDAFKNPKKYSIGNSHGAAWIRGRVIGKGKNGTVYLAKSRNPRNLFSEIAVKSDIFSNSSSLRKEKKILDKLINLSSHVIQSYGAEITTSQNGENIFYNLLLEYCSGGSLSDRINKWRGIGLPLAEVKSYTVDILRGLYWIHKSNYVHCDIKPANILLVPKSPISEGFNAKIAGFGSAKKVDKKSERLTGTCLYMSPEQIGFMIQGPPSDIWSLGCVLVEMISGNPVWEIEGKASDSEIHDLLMRIAYSPQLPEIPSDLCEEGKDFLRKCLNKNPSKRWTAQMLLQHPFLFNNLCRLVTEEEDEEDSHSVVDSCSALFLNDEFCFSVVSQEEIIV